MDISPQLRQKLDDIIEELRPLGRSVKWVKAESVHITLKFLGEVEASRIEPIQDAAVQAAQSSSRFELTAAGTGAFPNWRRPRVFWVGLEQSQALNQLQQSVESSLANIGFTPEKRAFKPHITLGRVRQGQDASAVSHALQSIQISPHVWNVSEFHLMKSELTPRGAIYTRLESFLV